MYCGKCGSKNLDEDNFCVSCGSPLNKKNLDKEDNIKESNSSNNNVCKKDKEFMSVAWLNFITIMWLIFGVLNVTIGLTYLNIDEYEILISGIIYIIQGIIQVITWYYVKERQEWGYYLFVLTLIINGVGSIYNTTISNLDTQYPESYFIGACVGALIFFIPNYIYIKKRKCLFNIEEDWE